MKAEYLIASSSLCLILGHPTASGFHVALRHFPTSLFPRRVTHNIAALLKIILRIFIGQS